MRVTLLRYETTHTNHKTQEQDKEIEKSLKSGSLCPISFFDITDAGYLFSYVVMGQQPRRGR